MDDVLTYLVMLTIIESELDNRTSGTPENKFIRRDLRDCIPPLSTTLNSKVGTRIAYSAYPGPLHQPQSEMWDY